MTMDDKDRAEQTTGNGTDQTCGKQLGGLKAHHSDLVGKSGELDRAFVHVSAKFQEEAKVLTADAMDLVKHPGRFAESGVTLAEGTAGESFGEIVGAGLGTVFGPEGTVIGAEVGGMLGEVIGVRQGGKIAKKIFHQSGTEHPLKEDLQQEGSSKLGSHAGRLIGGMIGDALFDDVGGEIGEAVGDKIGSLAGNLAFEHVARAHIKNNGEPPSDDVS